MQKETKDAPEVFITNENLKEVTEKLRSLIGRGWMTELAKKISETPEWKLWNNYDLTPDNLVHISKGIIKGQRHRILFVREASIMIQAHRDLAAGVDTQMKEAVNG